MQLMPHNPIGRQVYGRSFQCKSVVPLCPHVVYESKRKFNLNDKQMSTGYSLIQEWVALWEAVPSSVPR